MGMKRNDEEIMGDGGKKEEIIMGNDENDEV